MRLPGKLLLLLAVASLLASAADAAGRKLPVSAYIKSAKIELISGDLNRYPKAIAMLDSLAMNYGPHAEGLYWASQIYVDYIEKSAGPWEKEPYVAKMTAYIDSLHMCCADKKIKSDYRKGCDDFTTKGDSTLAKYWQQFYLEAAEQLDRVKESVDELETETDTLAREFIEKTRKAKTDSCRANLRLAEIIDSTDFHTYVALGSLYDYNKVSDTANIWLVRGLELTKAAGDAEGYLQLLLPVAYNFVSTNQYCDAIPYMKAWVDSAEHGGTIDTAKLSTVYNLTVCYNNCGFYDSAMVYYRLILKYDPGNASALSSIGRYFNQQARSATDSVKFYTDAKNDKMIKHWQAQVQSAFDSSAVYFRQVFEKVTDEAFAAEEYGVVSYLRQEWLEAEKAFQRLVQLKPDERENWATLGDIYLTQQKLDKAADAYEHAVELKPDDVHLWEQLVDLYKELGKSEKMKAAEKKLQQLKG